MVAVHAVARLIRVPIALSLKRWVSISATVLLFHHVAVAASQTPVGPMPTVERSHIESSSVPAWLYGFSAVQLELNAGIRLELVHIAVVSSEHEKRAALIGVLRNLGQRLSGVALTLSYVDSESGSIVRSVANTALMSEVGHRGFLPFRFPLPLRADLPSEVLSLRISVTEGVVGSRRAVRGTLRPGHSFRGESARGFLLAGGIEISSEETLQLSEQSGIFITLVLLDETGTLLDVLAGRPMSPPDANVWKFEFASFLPLRKRVKSIHLYLEAEPTTR